MSDLLSHANQDYLDTNEKLSSFVEEALGSHILAIDTEFIRERTYYPQLCLLQLATAKRSVIVDPLAIEDPSPLKDLFLSEHITKVFHAGDQDIEIIFHNLGVVPTPLFDTQLAAELLGSPQQTSLRNLVKDYAGVRLNKTDSFSNWGSRPLTDSQITYALDDVRYLPGIYEKMHTRLEELGRLNWLDEDFASLSDESKYTVHPDQAWRRVKHSSSLTPAQLGVLQELASTRERIAMKRDLPRKWILTDELMVEIARLSPQNTDELFHLRGAENQLGRHWGREILSAVKRGQAMPPDELPQRKSPVFRTAANAAANDLLRALINQRSRDNQVTPSMLVNKDELIRLAAGEREGLRILTGWRYKLVGKELLQLLEGKLSLRLNGNTVEVTTLS